MICYNQRISRAKQALENAAYVVIGGGAGFSDAAGLKYGGARFTSNFAPFIQKYGMTDMYTAGFYPFQTEEERWAYWARHISLNRFEAPPAELYRMLLQLVADKQHFVITTNVDSQFEKTGFSKDRIFEVQGNYAYLQCAAGCHDRLYYNEKIVKEMIENTSDCKIPASLVPKCPVCGGRMAPHIRCDMHFIQNKSWYAARENFDHFIEQTQGKSVVFLELGVGYNTPGIIRFPFEQMTYANKNAALIRLNKNQPDGAAENVCRTISFTEDMAEVLKTL